MHTMRANGNIFAFSLAIAATYDGPYVVPISPWTPYRLGRSDNRNLVLVTG